MRYVIPARSFKAGQSLTDRDLNQIKRATIPELVGDSGLNVHRQTNRVYVKTKPGLNQSFTMTRRFKITAVNDDYLDCHTLDLNNAGAATEGSTTVGVAKPHALRGGGGAYAVGDYLLACANLLGTTGVQDGSGNLILWEVVQGTGSTTTDGTPPVIVSEAGTAGTSAKVRPYDTIPGLKLYATQPGMSFKAADGGLGVIWGSVGVMKDVDDTATGIGTQDAVSHVDHNHKLNAGTGMEWYDAGGTRTLRVKVLSSGAIMYQSDATTWARLAIGTNGHFLKVVAGLPSWQSITEFPGFFEGDPDFIGDENDADDGGSSLAAKGDHRHPSTITGASNWQTDGNANEGKIYGVYKPDPV